MRNFSTKASFPVIFHISIHWAIPMFIKFCCLLNGILMRLTVLSVTHEEGAGFFPPSIRSFAFLDTRLHSFKYKVLAATKYWMLKCINSQRFVEKVKCLNWVSHLWLENTDKMMDREKRHSYKSYYGKYYSHIRHCPVLLFLFFFSFLNKAGYVMVH